ncbi:glycoside-pentoside-hexuronide (GPH):cation symporter [Mediterraneibacter sp. NSJ-151]|uniref:MFS transporter n=1 Tax=Ruminococcus hominis TaxID=2763065 RepID=A0ABR7GBS6_9FIRM|nr:MULTISPECIES: glycoside-pentoside-hexuronide (GPH):cation symporter [Clostridia]MBC5684196.1 MFS transporter [Ruminococcus hominis]MCH4280425.1 glycoside-pentoside-hexuronide (GPH):cation symporter [Mediterraneibacter sp. NSJ-151]RGH39091.1 MFS transporter [Firmicutes bacterium AM41-5BH]RHV03265.1 MFS transporter [Firmicutes bacterium OM07-11]
MEERKYLKWYNKVGYGIGDVAANCSYGLVTSFVLIYLTNTVGLNAGIVGTLIMASKLLDGISDIIFGMIIDRTKTKMGKARPWMFGAQFGVSITMIMLFAIPDMGANMQYVYFFIVYTLMNVIFYTASNIAYSSLTSLTTKNSNERVQLGSIRFIFSLLTNLVVATATVGLVEAFGGGAKGWKTVAIIFSVAALIINTISVFSIKELPEEELLGEKKIQEKVSLAAGIKVIVKNKYYLMILAIYVLYYGMMGVTQTVGIYYMTYVFEQPSLLGTFTLATLLPMIIVLAVTPALVKKKGMYKIINLGYDGAILFRGLFMVFAFMANKALMLITLLLNGFCTGPLVGSLNALISESSDYTYRTQKQRLDGMMFSCSSFGIKVGGGIGTAAAGWLLAAGGFDGQAAVQAASAVNMIKVSYAVVPFAVVVFMKLLVKALKVEEANKNWDAEHK